jgi:thiamine pyrophosphokinase
MSETSGNRIGLLFTGGEGPTASQCRAIVQEAEQTGKLLIAAADSGLLLAERAGVLPDWIIGDMDSLGAEASRLSAYPSEKVLRFPHDKNHTDTELALALLREKGACTIWIIGGGGGRLDHLFAIRSLFERDYPPARWITAKEKIYCIDAENDNVPAEISAGTEGMVSVFPLGSNSAETGGPAEAAATGAAATGAGQWKAESSGLKWPLDGLLWDRGFFGISNEAPGGSFTIRAKNGRFLILLL